MPLSEQPELLGPLVPEVTVWQIKKANLDQFTISKKLFELSN